jgi:hypothetical protein
LFKDSLFAGGFSLSRFLNWMEYIHILDGFVDDCVQTMEIDHSTRKVYSSVMLSGNSRSTVMPNSRTYEKSVSHRLSNPVVIAFVDLDKIAFER